VTRMRDAAKRMQLLISDILSYSRLGKVSEAFTQVSLNEAIEKALEELREEIAEKKATIHVGHLPAVNGIPFLITQLFLNLIRNSLKFTQENRSPVVTITQTDALAAAPQPLPNKKLYYEIALQDNGIGFSSKYKENIFNVFTRLNAHDKYGGSGVGLALCKKIMQNHEGFITAEGTEGEGAVFKLFFPVP